MYSFDLTYSRLPQDLWSASQPHKSPKPELLLGNTALAVRLGLDPDWLTNDAALSLFTGQAAADGYAPIAMAYAGHQFGHLSPQLGDGRAVLIGEHVAPDGVRYDLHLKGSGQTPYSRRGDGKSTLRAALKEYLFSESLAALGVPATRSLAVYLTGEEVLRDGLHPGAILVRTARSHVRVGTFVYAARLENPEALKALADFIVAREYPEISGPDKYTQFLTAVIERQAKLIAFWMGHGFVHGVMNTDNMAISGETIDFGPCAFMDEFHASSVYSAIDHHGRYAWNKQPEIALWNLTRFAETVLSLLSDDENNAVKIAEDALGAFMPTFTKAFHGQLLRKLGLTENHQDGQSLIHETFSLLQTSGVDFTLFFRQLAEDAGAFLALFEDRKTAQSWYDMWKAETRKTGKSPSEISVEMNAMNPHYIPRTYRTEEAFAAANAGDMGPFTRLLAAAQSPYQAKPEFDGLAVPPPSGEITPTHCET